MQNTPITTEPGLRAAIYARVSTDAQEEDGTSLNTQVENCLKLAEQRGFIVVEIFRESFTGSLYREREKLSKIRDLYRKGEIDVVIFNTFDRLSRNQIHLGVLIDEMQHYKLRMECVQEKFDSTATGQFMRNALAFVAEVEREKIAYRTDEGKRKKAREGFLINGKKALYGYNWKNGKRGAYEINLETSAIVVQIFTRYYEGSTARGIVTWLNDSNIPTPSSKGNWGYGTVRSILSNPFYIGKAASYRWREERTGGIRKAYKRPDEEQIRLPEGIVPAIISEQLYNIVQERLQINKVEASRHHPDLTATLLQNGFIKCGYCRHNLSVDRTTSRRSPIVYRCQHTKRSYISSRCLRGSSITPSMIDQGVWNFIGETIKDFSPIKQALELLRGKNLHDPEIRAIVRSIKALQETQEDLVSNLKNPKLKGRARELVLEELEKIESYLNSLEEEKQRVFQDQHQWQEIQNEIDEFIAWCLSVKDTYQTATYEEKRRALRVLGIATYIYREDDEEHDRYEIKVELLGT